LTRVPKKQTQVLLETLRREFGGADLTKIYTDHKSQPQSLVKAVRRVEKNQGVKGPRQNKVMLYSALSKIQHALSKRPDLAGIDKLTLTQFAAMVDCDDLGAALNGSIGTDHSQILRQIPEHHALLHAFSREGGLNCLSKTLNSNPRLPSTQYSGSSDVNLEHVACALTSIFPPVADPDDNPKAVFTQRATFTQVQTMSNGDGMFGYCGAMFASTGTNSTNCFQVVNTAAGYSANTGTGGTFVFLPGILSSSVTQFARTKIVGFEIEINPFTSLNTCEGGYICGFFPSEMSSLSAPLLSGTTLGISDLSQIPGFQTYNMKTTAYTRMWPVSTGGEEWTSVGFENRNLFDYTTFALIGYGLDASASFNIVGNIVYEVEPAKGAYNLLKGIVPKMGAFTTRFLQFMRNAHPNMVNWPPEEVCKYVERLIGCGSCRYDDLISITPEYQHKHTGHRLGVGSRGGFSMEILE